MVLLDRIFSIGLSGFQTAESTNNLNLFALTMQFIIQVAEMYTTNTANTAY